MRISLFMLWLLLVLLILLWSFTFPESAGGLLGLAAKQICTSLIESWSSDYTLSLAALEVLTLLAKVKLQIISTSMCKETVIQICRLINVLCNKPPRNQTRYDIMFSTSTFAYKIFGALLSGALLSGALLSGALLSGTLLSGMPVRRESAAQVCTKAVLTVAKVRSKDNVTPAPYASRRVNTG